MSLESILGPEGPLRVATPGGGSASDSTGGASNQHLMSDHALFLPPLSALFPIKHDHPAEVVQPLGGLPTKHDDQQQVSGALSPDLLPACLSPSSRPL